MQVELTSDSRLEKPSAQLQSCRKRSFMEREPVGITPQTVSPALSPVHSANAGRGGSGGHRAIFPETALTPTSAKPPPHHLPPILTFAGALATASFSNPLATPDPSTPSTTCTGSSSSQSQSQSPRTVSKVSQSTSIGSLMPLPLTSVGEPSSRTAEAHASLAERRLFLKRDAGDVSSGAELKPTIDPNEESSLSFSMPISRSAIDLARPTHEPDAKRMRHATTDTLHSLALQQAQLAQLTGLFQCFSRNSYF